MSEPVLHATLAPSVRRLVLVGCSAKKLRHAAPARELYRSPLFLAARAYAELGDDEGSSWAILSAKHGLLFPDEIVEPYDVSFRTLRASRVVVAAWTALVRDRLDFHFPRGRVIFLAGADYRAGVEHLNPRRLVEPLAGFGIGMRLRWLRRQVARAREGDIASRGAHARHVISDIASRAARVREVIS